MGRKQSLYSQSPNLRHVVEAGDQDAANVVVVESAVEREEKEAMNERHCVVHKRWGGMGRAVKQKVNN